MAGLELHEACTLGDYDTLEELLNTGRYDVDMPDVEWQDRAPIHWACTKGYVDCLRLLLEHGASPMARMSMGWTPAHCAAETGRLSILRALHVSGAPIDRPDKYGDEPRRLAEIYGHADCVKYFIQVESEGREGKSPPDVADHSSDNSDTSDNDARGTGNT